MQQATARGPRLGLRELTSGDVDAVFTIYGSPVVTQHLSFGPRTREQVGVIVARSMASATADPRQEYALAVADHRSGQLVGFARLALDPHQQQAATIGFALRETSWHQGYGGETVNLIFGLAFTRLVLHRVWAARAPDSIASARTLLAAGMVEEGRIRGHVHVRGTWRDSITYGGSV